MMRLDDQYFNELFHYSSRGAEEMAAEGGNSSVSDAGSAPGQVKIGKKKNRSRSASASSVSSVSSGSYTGNKIDI